MIFNTSLTSESKSSRSRRDNGLYVCVEWLEYIFGDLGAPGSLSKQRQLGPAVQEIWHWAAVRTHFSAYIHLDAHDRHVPRVHQNIEE
jgi:hypothetical protein